MPGCLAQRGAPSCASPRNSGAAADGGAAADKPVQLPPWVKGTECDSAGVLRSSLLCRPVQESSPHQPRPCHPPSFLGSPQWHGSSELKAPCKLSRVQPTAPTCRAERGVLGHKTPQAGIALAHPGGPRPRCCLVFP